MQQSFSALNLTLSAERRKEARASVTAAERRWSAAKEQAALTPLCTT